MEVVATPDKWTNLDAERLAGFLQTETGKRLLPSLAERVPTLLPKGDVNEILIRTGEVRGAQECLNNVLHLAHGDFSDKPATAAETYPRLDDDAKWNDGQKLDPAPSAEPSTAQE